MTRDGLFVTGGSGFVGGRLLPALAATGRRVLALDRTGRLTASAPTGVTVVPGALSSPDTYRDALATSDLVVHLAAATGRATAADNWRTNARGTVALLEACRAAGVRRFVFVSSIAVTFPDRRGYPYAQSKLAAEEAVRRSGLEFLIVRPAMILGPGAPILGALEKLAALPVLVVPGSGRARVQPIHVDDVVRALCGIATGDASWGETCEIGGPQVLTIDELLQQLRVSRGRPAGRALHVPLWLLRAPLRVAEALALGAMAPVTAGQLSSFRFDGVATPNAVQAHLAPALRGVPAMLGGARAPAAGTADPGLARECRVFVRHLIGRSPDEYVEQRYAAAHSGPLPLAAASPFDRLLLGVARVHPIGTRVADAYAALFARRAALRRKLVLLLAILETSRSFHGDLDRPLGGSFVAAVAALTASAAAGALAAAAGILLLLPAHGLLSLMPRGAR